MSALTGGGGVCCGRAVVKYYNCVSGLVYYIYYCSILVNGCDIILHLFHMQLLNPDANPSSLVDTRFLFDVCIKFFKHMYMLSR